MALFALAGLAACERPAAPPVPAFARDVAQP
jgi:hypothetical protein